MKLNKDGLVSYTLIIIGAVLFAITDVVFVNPYKLAPGGVYGLANVAHHLWGFKISAVAMVLEIPLLIIGTWLLGPKFGVKTIVSILVIAGTVYLVESFWGYEPLIKDDIFISTIVAGVLYGLATGLIFKAHATSGGTDIISMILSKYTGMSLGKMVLIVDSCVTITTFIAFKDVRLPIYSLILILINSRVIDMVLDGIKTYKTVLIISEKRTEIKSYIIDNLSRGGTFIEGEGMFSGEQKKVIYTVIDRREFLNLRDYISTVDPNAFINVIDSSEIMGEGFKKLKKSEI